jgi:hypothetical protein
MAVHAFSHEHDAIAVQSRATTRAPAPAPTEKEISIGACKKHFSSHSFPKFILTHQITDPV